MNVELKRRICDVIAMSRLGIMSSEEIDVRSSDTLAK
jgi:hypothetical protein